MDDVGPRDECDNSGEITDGGNVEALNGVVSLADWNILNGHHYLNRTA